MTEHAVHPDYPLEITRDEERLGFAVRLIGQLDDYNPDRWILVVCKVISSCDIVVKTVSFSGTGSMYSHRRFGRMDLGLSMMKNRTPDWNPVGMPYQTCEQAVFEATTGASEEDGPLVSGLKAPIQEA